MSDLQCAATVLVARPGQTESTPGGGPDALTRAGRAEVRRVAGSLASAGIAMVYCSDEVPVVQTAEILAAALGAHVEVRLALRPDGPDGQGGVASELGAIVDQHRGETVLVVGRGEVGALVLPFLAVNLPAGYARDHPLAPGSLVEAAADADGWVIRSWAGRPPVSAGGDGD